jgi:hypothetical protein
MGAPLGNRNNVKGKMIYDVLRKRLIQSPERLERIVEVLISEAENGKEWAIKEIMDRVDGKPTQFNVLETDATVMPTIEVRFVSPDQVINSPNYRQIDAC